MKNKKENSTKINLENIKIYFKIFLKYLLYALVLAGLVFGVYKVFNWKKIFDREYDSAQMIKRKIDLPPIIKNASSTTDIVYADQLFLESIIDKLKIQNVKISQIEETENNFDYSLLTTDGYRLKVSLRVDRNLLIDNIISIYTSRDFKSELEKSNQKNKTENSSSSSSTAATSSSGSKLEYIDFRFKDKVFYKFR